MTDDADTNATTGEKGTGAAGESLAVPTNAGAAEMASNGIS